MITRRIIEAMRDFRLEGWMAERYEPDTSPKEAYMLSYRQWPLCVVEITEDNDQFLTTQFATPEAAWHVAMAHLEQLEPK